MQKPKNALGTPAGVFACNSLLASKPRSTPHSGCPSVDTRYHSLYTPAVTELHGCRLAASCESETKQAAADLQKLQRHLRRSVQTIQEAVHRATALVNAPPGMPLEPVDQTIKHMEHIEQEITAFRKAEQRATEQLSHAVGEHVDANVQHADRLMHASMRMQLLVKYGRQHASFAECPVCGDESSGSTFSHDTFSHAAISLMRQRCAWTGSIPASYASLAHSQSRAELLALQEGVLQRDLELMEQRLEAVASEADGPSRPVHPGMAARQAQSRQVKASTCLL